MKTRAIILWGSLYVIFILALGIAAFFFWSKSKEVPAPVALPLSQLQSHMATSNPVERPVRMKKHVMHGVPTPEEKVLMDQWMKQLQNDSFSEWKTPIDFYGLVIDENKQPISGAKVIWDTTTENGNGHGETSSGSDGRFSIHTAGKVMSFVVKKEGYLPFGKWENGFEFSAFYQENYYDGDEQHPTICYLHKIPPPEPLYIWDKQIRNANKLIGSQLTLNPRTGELDNGKGKEGVQIQLLPGPDNNAQREQFNIILTTSGQGILPLTDQYDGLAPSSGYTNSDQKTLVDYNQVRFTDTSVFFQDGSGNYGEVDLDIKLLDHELCIGYRLRYNPNGGTSLSAQGGKYLINKR